MVIRYTQTFSQTLVDLKKLKYRFRSDFEKVVLFTDLLDELCIVSKCGFENIELYSFIVSWVRRCETIVFDLNLRTNDLFKKLFRSRQCATKAYLFSNVVKHFFTFSPIDNVRLDASVRFWAWVFLSVECDWNSKISQIPNLGFWKKDGPKLLWNLLI